MTRRELAMELLKDSSKLEEEVFLFDSEMENYYKLKTLESITANMVSDSCADLNIDFEDNQHNVQITVLNV